MKCSLDWTAQAIKKIFFFSLLAHLKSRLARGKNYHLFGGHIKKTDRGTEIWKSHPHTVLCSQLRHKDSTLEYTGCVFTGGKKYVTHPWKVLGNAKEKFIGSLQH